ncbi:hypothetical protein COBT_000979 [Conglomerata obtusa]
MLYKINDFIDEILSKTTEKHEPSFSTAKLPLEITQPKIDLSFKPTIPRKEKTFIPPNWAENVLPQSQLMQKYAKSKHKYKYKTSMIKSQGLSFKNTRPKTIANELTIFDYELLKHIHPSELVDYDGRSDQCAQIELIKSKNKLFTNLVYNEIKDDFTNVKYFIKLAKHLDTIKNFSSLSCVLTALKRHKLEDQYFECVNGLYKRTQDYFQMRNMMERCNDNYVIPVDYMLKDLEELNKNRHSEIAAKRFCQLVEYLVRIQNNDQKRSKKKYEHFLKWKMINGGKKEFVDVEKEPEISIGSIFLFL